MRRAPRPSAAPPRRPHGWSRAVDRFDAVRRSSWRAAEQSPVGTSFLLGLAVVLLAVIGIARVRSTVEVLELGAEITSLTSEHSRLLEKQRRLAAERAYLRHPTRLEALARQRLGLVPIAPELVQHIRLTEGGSGQ